MISYSAWLHLPIHTRHELARIFKIPKTGATEVVSNDIVRDGYSVHDIEKAITKQAMQTFLGSTMDNFQFLWEDTLNVIEKRPAVLHGETFTAATEEEPVKTADEPMSLDVPPLPTVEEQINQKTRRIGRPRGRPKKP